MNNEEVAGCRHGFQSGKRGCKPTMSIKTYAQALGNKKYSVELKFNMKKEDMVRFEKAFVGVVEKLGSTYNMQDALYAEGYFWIKATPLGTNLCLLEENDDIDNEKLMCISCYGLPCHVWCHKFFKFISVTVGEFICCDEETEKHKNLDVARFLIKTKYSLNLNETFNVDVNNRIYRVKLVEDMHGPKRILVPNIDSRMSESEDVDRRRTTTRGVKLKRKKMVDGGVAHVLKEKFKLLRERLRWWNKNVFGWVDLKIEERVNTLNDTEVGMERDSGKVLVTDLLKRNVVQEDIWNNLHLKESMLKKVKIKMGEGW
ncbi:hypothetical protein KIW84_023976 [Lathyrus oleraceus]|uniref:DUF4283 domain-containing protein n=1 Tax=Pisum sativum TaxID=3888 RepID=A0A9D4YKA1_PEA|nr:hypothetical protein KIW84_023976 [Pisum sativum]